MSALRIGNVMIACEDGIVTFNDPLRQSPLQLNYDDFPLLLDVLDGLDWDRRRAFRIPVWTDKRLQTVLEFQGSTYEVAAVDISVAGILVDLSDDAPELSIDDSVGIALEFQGVKATLSGVVRHCEGRRYGIVFPATVDREQISLPLELRLIVNQIEGQWLAERIEQTPAANEPISPAR